MFTSERSRRETLRSLRVRRLEDFDDPSFTREHWGQLVRRGASDVVFLQWEWQRAWWEAFHPGELLLLLAERDGDPVALAPFYTDGWMAYFVGSNCSDRLDFVGDVSDPRVLDALLSEVNTCIADFRGLALGPIPAASPTADLLGAASRRLGYAFKERKRSPALALELGPGGEYGLAAAKKRDLLRNERSMERAGRVEVRRFDRAPDILGQLDTFFDQHARRWSGTASPSVFERRSHREFVRGLVKLADETGWLRFVRLEWEGRPVAFDLGTIYADTYFSHITTFDIDVARMSPGMVLQRQLLLSALEEQVSVFDFGLGDEPYKRRFANRMSSAATFRLTPGCA